VLFKEFQFKLFWNRDRGLRLEFLDDLEDLIDHRLRDPTVIFRNGSGRSSLLQEDCIEANDLPLRYVGRICREEHRSAIRILVTRTIDHMNQRIGIHRRQILEEAALLVSIHIPMRVCMQQPSGRMPSLDIAQDQRSILAGLEDLLRNSKSIFIILAELFKHVGERAISLLGKSDLQESLDLALIFLFDFDRPPGADHQRLLNIHSDAYLIVFKHLFINAILLIALHQGIRVVWALERISVISRFGERAFGRACIDFFNQIQLATAGALAFRHLASLLIERLSFSGLRDLIIGAVFRFGVALLFGSFLDRRF
jgi:hypothetical protein